MSQPAPRRRPPATLFGGAFGAVMGVYVFFILGIIVANFYLVAGTSLGRKQFWESITSSQIWHAVWLSVWTSSVAAAISLAMSVPAGYVLSRSRRRFVGLLDAAVDIPIVLPPLLFGISLLVLFQRSMVGPVLESVGLKFVHRPLGIVLVQVLIATAYGARMLKGTFDGIDPRMAAVARTLGCTPARAFFTVTMSAARNGTVAAFVMIWARALALYGPVIAFVGSTTNYTEVMPTRMYLEMSVGRLEAALAVALMMIFIAVVVLLVVKLWCGRSADQVGRMTRV
ncbi:MAG: ABC transporter permease [Planctomycetota bacterium]|jgi:molybdate transport system permease protein